MYMRLKEELYGRTETLSFSMDKYGLKKLKLHCTISELDIDYVPIITLAMFNV